jgi:hypothetical protein
MGLAAMTSWSRAGAWIGLLWIGAQTASAADLLSVPAPDLKAGDAWTYDHSFERGAGGFTEQRLDYKVQHVGADAMVVGVKLHGSPVDFEDHIMGPDWSQRRIYEGKQVVIGQPFSFPLTIGKTWTIDRVDPTRIGLQTSATHHETYKVTGWEDVTTSAGTFHALKVESDDKVKVDYMGVNAAVGGAVATADGSTAISRSGRSAAHSVYLENFFTYYYVPQIKYWVKTVEDQFNSEGVRTSRETYLLVSSTLAP